MELGTIIIFILLLFSVAINIFIFWKPIRWRAKFIEPDHKAGTIRIQRKYAWLPCNIKGEYIFLGRFEILELFVFFEYQFIDSYGKEKVVNVGKWVEVDKRMIL